MPKLYKPEDNALFFRVDVGTAEIGEGKTAELASSAGKSAPIITYEGYTVVFDWQEMLQTAVNMIEKAKKESNAATLDPEEI